MRRHFDQLTPEEQTALLARLHPSFRDVGVWMSPPDQEERPDEVAFWDERKAIVVGCVRRATLQALARRESEGAA